MNMETLQETYTCFFSHDYGTWSFLFVDGWLTFDGLRYICFFDVTSNARKSLSRSAR